MSTLQLPLQRHPARGRAAGRSVARILLHLVVAAFAVVFIVPFLWLVFSSLKTITEVSIDVSAAWLPKVPQWSNYVEIFQQIPLLRYLGNSAFITVLTTVGILFSASLAAYSVTRIQWRGARILFPLMMSTLLLPFPVTMIPLYMVFKTLHLTGTLAPLILPAFFGGGIGGGYYIFLLRQFYLTVPDSLFESARLDGAGELRLFLWIMMPLCRAALITVAIFTFLNTWSDFLGPLIYLTKQELYTLSLGLKAFMSEHFVQWNYLMAASVVFIVPTVLLFFVAQRYFIEGVKTTGLKA